MWRTPTCPGLVNNSRLRRAMAGPALPKEGEAATFRCASPREQLFHVSKNAGKCFIIGIACVYAAMIESMPSGVLQPAVAATNAVPQQTPLLSFGAEAPFRVPGMQFNSKTPPQPSVPSTEDKKRQSRLPRVQLLAEQRRLAALKQKQVEETQGISGLTREEYGQREHSRKSEKERETTDDISNGYGMDDREEILMSPMHYPVAGKTSLPGGVVHSPAAAETSEEGEDQLRRPSSEKRSLEELNATDSLHSGRTATLYGEILPTDIDAHTAAFGKFPEGVPVDSPLSGPLEELYTSGYAEAYDTLLQPDEKGSPYSTVQQDAEHGPPAAVATALSNYRSDDVVTDQDADPQNWGGRQSDTMWEEPEQNGQLRGLHSTQEHLHQQDQKHSATVSLPTTVRSDAADVTHGSATAWAADGTGDLVKGAPLFDSVPSDDPLSFPRTPATDEPVPIIHSEYFGEPDGKGDFAKGKGEGATPFTTFEPTGEADLPTSVENIAFSSPPRRAEPQEGASAAGGMPAETEGGGEGFADQEAVDREEAPPEENEESGADELDVEATDPAATASEDITESPTEDLGDSSVIVDPREGACSPEELTALTEYFSKQSESCAAYRCIDEAGTDFLEKLQEHYGSAYEPAQLEELAGLFAACYCRCPMMKCEVDYVMDNGGPTCKAATVDYCETSNEKFVQRCTSAAEQLPLLYDIRLDTAGFKVPCRVCRREDLETSVIGHGPTVGGTDEVQPPLERDGTPAAPSDSSSTTAFNNVVAGSTPPADEGVLDQESEAYDEGSYQEGAEGGNEEAGLNLDDDNYDEELPFLQLDQHVSTMPSTISSSPIQDTTTEQEGGVLPIEVEQDSALEAESDSLEETQEPIHPSTPTVPPSAGSGETETSMGDQSQEPSPVDQEEGPVDRVTTKSSAARQAMIPLGHLVAVVAPLLITSLAT